MDHVLFIFSLNERALARPSDHEAPSDPPTSGIGQPGPNSGEPTAGTHSSDRSGNVEDR